MKSECSVLVDGALRQSSSTGDGEDKSIKTDASGSHCKGQIRGFRIVSANMPSGRSAIAAAVAILVGCILIAEAETSFAETAQFAPLNPDFIDYQRYIQVEPVSARTDETEELLGYVPASISITAMTGADRARKAEPRSFPASYDLRQSGRLTPVKSQNISGPCWSFAAMASLESCRLPGAAYDFSEKNMVNLHGWDWKHTNGGNGVIAMAYLCRWDGPVNESDDPYPAGTWQSSQSGLPVQKHIQQVRMILGKSSPTDNDDIKQALTDHGAVFASYFHTNTSYSSDNNAYYYTGTNSGNHAVAIVGWDDNFDRTRFPVAAPSNGAYIVKNSWGTGWGDAGYFYVSYYDSIFAHEDMFVFHNAESVGNYSRCYQYDPLGWFNSFKEPWAAAIYMASASEPLQAVGLYSATAASYELFIYTNVAAGVPRSGALASSMSGTLPSAGFHTVPLATPVAVVAGQRFSIVLRLINGGDYPQAIEYRYSGLTSAATAAPGQTFYSTDGSQFTDLTALESTANFCIKGYTGTATTPPGMPVISSATHPDENGWYSKGNPSFAWTTPSDAFGIAGYSYVLDGSGTTIPDNTVDTTGNSKSYSSIPDGIWYFHVRAKNNAGIWGDADHYRARIDKTAPTFSSIAASPSLAKQGAAVTITFTASETLAANPAVTVNNHAASYGSKSGNNYTYSYAVLSSDSDGAATIAISASDLAGNAGAASNATALDVDKTAPGCTIARDDTSPTSASTVRFSVDFSESVTGFVQADVDLTGTAPGKSITGFSGGPQNFTVTVSDISGNGTAAINVNAGKCSDAAGNLNTVGASVSYTIVQTSPSVTIAPSGGSTTVTEGGANDTYTVVLNTQPAANVTISVNPGSQLSAAPTTLTFIPDQWNVAQTVTVSAVNDAIYEGIHSGTITHTAASTDGNYNGISVANVPVTITDNDAAPTVSFTSASQSKTEGGGTATVTAQLSAVSGLAASVPFTVSGSATGGGTDFTITASPIAIPAGSTTGSATITIIDDALDEDDETVVVMMGLPVNATQGAAIVHTLTITDNDAAPTVSFTSASQNKTEGGGTATVTAQLSTVSGKAVSVPFTVSGTATGGGTDYAITASPIAIPAGATNASATITIIDDVRAETDEAVIVTMESPVNAIRGSPSVHTLTITDNDAQGLVVSPTTLSVPEGGTATFAVQLRAQPQSIMTVTTARISGDISLNVSVGGTLTFNSGDWNLLKNVTLAAAVDEDDENGSAIIAVSLSGVTTVNVAAIEVDKDQAQFWGIFVDASRPDDSGDGYSWATAKKTIQAGVDLATDGMTVLVTNGIYNLGSRVTPGYALSNRVVITKAINVRSVNGASTTVIEGSGTNAFGTAAAMRCVFMNKGVLDGFTLNGGATMINNTVHYDQSGGGSFGGTLNNCTLSGNIARQGGGVALGTLNNCVLSDNTADNTGGGCYVSTLSNCMLSGNMANTGGGSTGGDLINCTLLGNMGFSWGGGAFQGTLKNCMLSGNMANTGGGSFQSTLYNCTLSGNTASGNGGGSYMGEMINCTFLRNTASNSGGGSLSSTLVNCTLCNNTAAQGGGVFGGTLNNCIVWGNRLVGGSPSDVGDGVCYYTCASDLVPSNGCLNVDPLFMDAANGNLRLQPGSPCIDLGDDSLAPDYLDADRNVRIADGNSDGTATVDMGAYEYGATAGIVVAFEAQGGTEPNPQTSIVRNGLVYGTLATTTRAGYSFKGWWTDQGGTGTQVAPTTTVTRTYDHALYAKWMPEVSGRILYVNDGRPDDSGDGFSWSTAKKTIQAALNEAADGETIWVTNGIYNAGGTVVSGSFLSNRVMIAKDVSVRSVNGSAVTTITGSGTNFCGTARAMRCVFMSKGVLDGFTLRGGSTRLRGIWDSQGGGLFCRDDSPQINNCVILECMSVDSGGGSYRGHLNNCTLSGNTGYRLTLSGDAEYRGGGAAWGGYLNNCTLTGNTGYYGGGSRGGGLINCVVRDNSGYEGGGVNNCTLNNCTLTGNTANHGGGSYRGELNNCTIISNSALSGSGGGAREGVLNNCILVGNTAHDGGGGAAQSTLNNCTLSGNTANYGGGSSHGTLNNSVVWGNTMSGGGASDVYSGTYFYTCAPDLSVSNECISADPLFVDATGGDFRLQTGSPCIDQGDNTLAPSIPDLDGNVRLADGNSDGTATVDMGAYEYGFMPATFTVTYDAQGGTAPIPLFKTITYRSTYGALATTTRSGYSFAGWWTGSGDTGMEVWPDTLVTNTTAHSLYAKWTPNNYTVTFNPSSGIASSPATKTVTYDSTYGALATTTRSGHTFAGWWTGVGGIGAQVTASTSMTTVSNHTLYAKWDELTTTTTPISVPLSWLDGQPLLLGASGGDYDIAAWTDLDRDGRFAWEEYIADTDPEDGDSSFPPLASVRQPSNTLGLTINPSSTSRFYEILWSPDIAEQPQLWIPYGPGRTGTGTGLVFDVTNEAPTGVFRSRVRLP